MNFDDSNRFLGVDNHYANNAFYKNSLSCKMEEFSRNFESKVTEIERCTDCSSTELTTEKYYQILHRLIELENNVKKKTHKDYCMLNKFVLIEFNVEGEVIKKLTKRGTQSRYVII